MVVSRTSLLIMQFERIVTKLQYKLTNSTACCSPSQIEDTITIPITWKAALLMWKTMNFQQWWRWWYYATPSKGWGRRGTPRRPNSRATLQGLDHRSRIEREEPKIDLRRGSEAGQSRRR